MKPEWRAPACYLGVALLCAIYLWTAPGFAIADVMAGAGLGAAAMWALNDWETRHPDRADKDEEEALPLQEQQRPRRPVQRREVEPDEIPRHTPRHERVTREVEERPRARPVKREERPVEAPVERRAKPAARKSEARWEEDTDWRETRPKPPQMRTPEMRPPEIETASRETPIEAWRREVRERDQARIEEKLRLLADKQPPEDPPFGTPERPPLPVRSAADRKAAERWSRPPRQGARSFPRN